LFKRFLAVEISKICGQMISGKSWEKRGASKNKQQNR